MGLVERRALKAFQEGRYPTLKKEMDEVAGFEVDVQVAWDTLVVDDYAHLYEEGWTKVYFTPVCEAFKEICIDDMGKEALREGLKKVIIRHSGSNEFSFASGVLTVDYWPVTNIDDWMDRKRQIQKALEKGL